MAHWGKSACYPACQPEFVPVSIGSLLILKKKKKTSLQMSSDLYMHALACTCAHEWMHIHTHINKCNKNFLLEIIILLK